MTKTRRFAPPQPWPSGPGDIETAVDAARGPLTGDPPLESTGTLSLRDTPDGRLAKAGWRLQCAPAGPGTEAWRLVDGAGRDIASATLRQPVPGFADGLPDGRLAKTLEDLCRSRALRPALEVDWHATDIALRDGEGKIRCRLVAETVTDRDQPARTATTVSVIALKCYRNDADTVAGRLITRLGWPNHAGEPIELICKQASGSLPARPTHDPAPSDPAGAVLREILSHQLDVIEDRLPGVLADTDSTYLHQMRVAIRRTRSALSQLGPALATEGRAEAVEGFRWLGQVTGPARDLDVQLIDLAERRGREDGDGLAALERHLKREKKRTQKALVRTLQGPRFAEVIAGWRRSLDPAVGDWSATDTARAPFAWVVGARAAKLHRRVLKDGRRITPDTPAEALHELRIRMKKLRYVVEFLGDVHPRERMRPVIKVLKGLQDVLGRHQDREVQVEALRRYGHALAGPRAGNADALMAIGAWSVELEADRRHAREEFAAAFKAFASKETRALFHAIFAPPVGAPVDTAAGEDDPPSQTAQQLEPT